MSMKREKMGEKVAAPLCLCTAVLVLAAEARPETETHVFLSDRHIQRDLSVLSLCYLFFFF